MLHHKPDLKARLRQAWQVFLLGGPVGLAYAVRVAVIDWRLRHATNNIEREKAVHRQELNKLRDQVNILTGQQLCLHVAAAQFRRYCEKKALAAEVES